MVGLKIVQGVAALTQKIQQLHWGLLIHGGIG